MSFSEASSAVWRREPWNGGSWEEEGPWNGCEARLYAVLLAHPELQVPGHGLDQDYLACCAYMSRRSVIRALQVLELAGAVTCTRSRSRGADEGAPEVNTYEPHPEVYARWAGRKRPSTWNLRKGPVGDHVVARTAAHSASVQAACERVALPGHEARPLLALAKRADDAEYRRARAEQGAAARLAALEKRAAHAQQLHAQVEAKLAELEARPKPEALPLDATEPGAPPESAVASTARPVPEAALPATPPPAPAAADGLTDEQAIAAIEQLVREHPEDWRLGVLARQARAGHDWSRSTCHVYLQTPCWSPKQEHVLRDRLKKEQRGPAIRDAGAEALTDEHRQLVEVWEQARTKRNLETAVDPRPAHLVAYWDACQAAADKAARKANGEWSPSAFEIARWGIHSYLHETQTMAGGVQDQDYPFALLATRLEKLNSYKLPSRRWCEGVRRALPSIAEGESASSETSAAEMPPAPAADSAELAREAQRQFENNSRVGGLRPR